VPPIRQVGKILLVGDGPLPISERFRSELKAFDSSLIVLYNEHGMHAGKYQIEKCIEHHGGGDHSHLCRRMYVMTVQGDEGEPLPLGDHVFAKLRMMRQMAEQFGDPNDPATIEKATKYFADLEAERQAKERADMREVARLNSLDHRVQLNKARMLIQRHDMRINQ
jgi:hypothetical protein